jgi:hypothetical protein
LSNAEGSPFPNGSGTRASPRSQFSRENSYQERNGREPHRRYSSYDRNYPPPPPPPPARKQRYFDGPLGLHSSSADVHSRDSWTNCQNRSPPSEDTNQIRDIPSPSRSRSDPHITRKRSYRHSSEESDGGPKRQEDENTQRRKRNEPKIAAAYR